MSSKRPYRALVFRDQYAPTEQPQPNPDMRDRACELVRIAYTAAIRETTGKLSYGDSYIPAWDGGRDRWGTTHKAVWPKIVAAITELDADPLLYIRAQFELHPGERPPTPNMLHGVKAVSKYREYCGDAKVRLAARMKSQMDSVLRESRLMDRYWQRGSAAMRYALLERSHVSATDFLRYCLAVGAGFSDIAEPLRESALLEYVFQQPLYDELLGSVIPTELRDAATALRAQLAF